MNKIDWSRNFEWFVNIGGTISSILVIIYMIILIKYILFDKTTTLKVNVYATLTEHYHEALTKTPEEIKNYFQNKFPIGKTEIIPNEFIAEKKRKIMAEIILTNPNKLAVVIGSDEHDIKILNIYNREGNKIEHINVNKRKDMPTKNQTKIEKGQLKLNKGDYIAILTQEFGENGEQEIEIEVDGHKKTISLSPLHMNPNPTNYIEVKNNIKSYIIKYLKK